MFEKYSVLRSIRKFISKLKRLEPERHDITDILRWQSAVEDLFKELYRHDAHFVDALHSLQAGILSTAQAAKETSRGVYRDSEDSPWSERMKTYRSAAISLLETVRRDIRTNGLPFSYSAPIKRVWLGHGVSFILGIIATLIAGGILGYFQSATEKERNMAQAGLLLSDLRSWSQENLDAFEPGWDSVCSKYSGSGGFISGDVVPALAEYAKSFRRNRDHVIDSVLHRLAGLGVDTDTIEIRRRLSGRIGSQIRSLEPKFGLDVGVFSEFYVLDTL